MKASVPPLLAFRPSVGTRVAAFTLVEMLVVMGIIVILITIVAPASSTILKGNDLTQGGQDLSSQIAVARQSALTQNHPVEVRFYQYGDASKPGESVADPTSGRFRAMQSFAISEAGVATPLDKRHNLPNTVLIDSGTTLSTLIGNASANGASGSGPIRTTAPQAYPLPEIGKNYNSVAFRFFPDGSTNLPLAAGTTVNSWFITLHSSQYGDHPPTVPPNFMTIQIDASNGHTREFRP